MRIKQLFAATAIASVLSFSFVSCSDDDDFNPEAVLTTKDLSKDSKTNNSKGTVTEKASGVFELRNFNQLTVTEEGTATSEKASVYYFDFASNDASTAEAAPIKLNATQRVIDHVPNIAAGYSLSYIEKAFELVKANDEFTAAPNDKLGLAFGGSQGWASYSGAPAHRVDAKKDFTMIVMKDNKAVFKYRVNSIYEDEKPNKDVEPDNMVFYSIDYQAL